MYKLILTFLTGCMLVWNCVQCYQVWTHREEYTESSLFIVLLCTIGAFVCWITILMGALK